MTDLFTPTDHQEWHYWASVFLAHVALGMVLVAALAAFLEAIAGEWIDDLGALSWAIVVSVYGVFWEGVIQNLGAGWADAAVDTFAVASGGAFGVFLWLRLPTRAAVVAALVDAALWLGVRARK